MRLIKHYLPSKGGASNRQSGGNQAMTSINVT